MRRTPPIIVAVGVIVVGVWLLFSQGGDAVVTDEQREVVEALGSVPTTSAQLQTPPAGDRESSSPAIVDSAIRDPEERATPTMAELEILETFDHDTDAFTQGLEFSEGALFESTGLVGSSTLRELDPSSGATIRSVNVPDFFAEGITIIEEPTGDSIVQLTWQDEVALRYDADTFEVIDTYSYEGQGWGICHDGERLVMSSGSSTLQFRDPDDFSLQGTVDVTFDGVPVELLNELECVNGRVWANIWMSALIIEIDPESGAITRVLDAEELIPPGFEGSRSNVLNGVAYDPADDTFLLTGKRWPLLYRVRIS